MEGHEARVLLDTGASMTVLSSSLHLPTSSEERFVASGVDGKSTKVRTAEVEIKLGDQYSGVTALVSDMKLKFCGRPVDGCADASVEAVKV